MMEMSVPSTTPAPLMDAMRIRWTAMTAIPVHRTFATQQLDAITFPLKGCAATGMHAQKMIPAKEALVSGTLWIAMTPIHAPMRSATQIRAAFMMSPTRNVDSAPQHNPWSAGVQSWPPWRLE